MKKIVVLLIVGVMAVGAMSAWAGGGCCSAKKAGASCMDQMGSLSLTDDQKTKITEIEALCKEAGDDKEACTKYKAQIRDVLTEEQRAQFDEAIKAKADKASHEKTET
jgi:Spy/CpxP family protein refolding chaperone